MMSPFPRPPFSSSGNDSGIRVVYNFKRTDDSGSNTQYIRLSGADVAELAASVP
jgi:hypothetical protein